ncbi:hypothetical protein SAMN04488103_1274 [Gemmobacter aquatilis]|uniref:Uncharacterized protein n=1 Tax=Gemmobacter aquatilis TaxID=933059 RepID=A0A1H8NZS7_9RHOB|nr:hypothetical protein SAMN04488103_1274 [Gemmobacter aquatilis]
MPGLRYRPFSKITALANLLQQASLQNQRQLGLSRHFVELDWKRFGQMMSQPFHQTLSIKCGGRCGPNVAMKVLWRMYVNGLDCELQE